MGRIKSTLVKKTAKKLLEEDNPFSGEFNHNKKALGNTMPSKSLRNKIAGYLARILTQNKQDEAKQSTTEKIKAI